MSKKVLVTGDIHACSDVAVMPQCAFNVDYDASKLDCGKTLKMDFEEVKNITPNFKSRFLFKKYQELLDDVGPVDMHINLAETCDGPNKRGQGKETYTTDMMTQVGTAVYLESLIKAKQRVIMQGSYYHTGQNCSSDELVAKLLGASHHYDLKLTVEKSACYFRHPIGSTKGPWMYKPTKVAKEMLLGELNKDEYGKFNVYGFGHVHSFVGVEYGNSYGFTCPGWKGRDSYAKLGSLAWLPQCGYMLFEFEGSNIKRFKHTFSPKGRHVIDEVKI